MKRIKKYVSLFLLLAMVLSTGLITVSASNYQDTSFSNIELSYNHFTHPIPVRTKTDSTPVFLHLKDISYTFAGVGVQALGTNSYNVTPGNVANLTYSNGALTGMVFCIENWKYSIHSLIYERGFRYASLRFKSSVTTGSHIWDAVWSPDSIGSYNQSS